MHVFPRNKSGVAFQVHHVISEESGETKTTSGQSDDPGSVKQGSLKTGSGKSGPLSSESGLWMRKIEDKDSLNVQENFYSNSSPKNPRISAKGASLDASPYLGRKGLPSDSPNQARENFSSARRQGADWRSLSEPACLPITTDYFPTNEKLSRDFYEYPSKPEASEEKKTVGGNSTFQAFTEMISQRLSQVG